MPQGFFASSEIQTKAPPSLVAKCGACGLLNTCLSPKMAVSGKGGRRILVVGEAPGEEEDQQGRQFVGKTGKDLFAVLRKHNVEPREDCWFTNALICRPPNNVIPNDSMIDYCRPNLIKTVRELQPEVIILLGGRAVESLIGWLWKEDLGGVNRWVGWQIPSQRLNAFVCPTYHPSFVARSKDPVVTKLFEDHLGRACSLKGRPYVTVPNYPSQVEVLFDLDRAAHLLRKMVEKGGTISFDYETDRLKPDHPDARIVCCSVCWEGQKTIAYPWHGPVIEATKDLLASNLYKIGQNCKFEHRWTLAKLGVEVRNWKWDCMLASHVLDNRAAITSIKFQQFVQLGAESYDDNIKPYLGSGRKAGNVPNRIKEVDLHTLCLYCGMDSLLEFLVAQKQMKEFGL